MPNQTKLEIKVKGGIINTISKAIYSSTTDKIRELVANSRDADSECVVISIDKDNKKLSIFDNGKGIDKDDIKKIFESLGYGLKRDKEGALSHFGLGLISILQLSTTKAYLYSKAKSKKAVLANIDTKELFDEHNETKNLNDYNFIDIYNKIDDDFINSTSSINKVLLKNKDLKEKYKFDTFTEIVLTDVLDSVLAEFENNTFSDQLSKTLPIGINKSDPFFDKIKSEKLKKSMIDFFEDETYCKTIDVFVNDEGFINEVNNGSDVKTDIITGLEKLYKYFPSFGRLREVTEENLVINEGINYKFYLLAKVDDLFTKEEGYQGKKVTGFTLRNQNFLVKENDYFDYDFLPDSLVNKPLRSWLYGEVFHKNLNEMLQVSRKDIIESNKDFQDFANDFAKKIDDINAKLRQAYNQRKEIRDSFVTPIRKIIEGESFRKIQNNIGTFFDNDPEKVEHFNKDIIQKLKTRTKKDWFNNESCLLKNILKKTEIEVKYDKFKIIISDLVNTESGEEMVAPISGKDNINTLKLSRSFFNTHSVDFLGEKFDVKFVYLGPDKGKTADAISYNVTDNKKEIFINIFNDKIKNYQIDVLEVIVLVDLAYSRSNDKDDMREYLLDYLQDNYKSIANQTLITRLGKYLTMKVDI